MDENERYIWLNGEELKVSEAKINVLSPMAQFGANVFEGIRCYWNEEQEQLYAFRLPEHYRRLKASAEAFKMQAAYTEEQLFESFKGIIKKNHYRQDIAVRQTMFVEGFGSWFSKEPVGMFIAPIAKERKHVPLQGGVTCMVSSWERIHEGVLSPKVKVGANYINSRFAQLEAMENGFDTALFLNREGMVSEGPGSCFFFVKDEVLITPSLDSSILESITRDTVIRIAKKELGLKVEERHVTREELYGCDEAFFCGSAVELNPVSKIDNYVLPQRTPGRITTDLHRKYIEIVSGQNKSYREWLTPIYA